MKGIVFNILQEVTTERHGAVFWDEVVDAAGVEGAYTSLGNYDDGDLDALFIALAERHDMAVDEAVRGFARDAAAQFAVRYPGLFEPFTDARDILRALNDIIHPEVRKLYPGASVPHFENRETDEGFELIYTSPKRMCAFAEGLIAGTADNYGQDVEIHQPECMHFGDPHCRLVCAFSEADAAKSAKGRADTKLQRSEASTEHAAVRPSTEAAHAEGIEAGIHRLKRRLDREHRARLEAEAVAEASTRSLYEANQRLARSNEDLDRFASAASHDLKEPLRMVASFVDLLASRREHDAEAEEWMGYVQEGVVRMRTLIDDLLVYSRAERLLDTYEDVDMGRLVHEVLDDIRPILKETDADVTVNPLPVVPAARPLMRQLFTNLIGNAIKFHRPDVPPKVVVSGRRDGGHWRFEVRDNGIGFEAKYAQRIFLMFERLHNRSTYPGTGLGLALCKRIVELHGGTIGAAPLKGHGARFWFTLPVLKHKVVDTNDILEAMAGPGAHHGHGLPG